MCNKTFTKWKQSIKMDPKQKQRLKVNQTKYRKKTKQRNERNAAIVAYLEKHFQWVLEAFNIKNSKEKVITNIDFFFFILNLHNVFVF